MPSVSYQQGYYVYGGMTNKGVSNRLHVIDIHNSIIKVFTPDTVGLHPHARYLHRQQYIESKHILVIVGGKYEEGDCMDRSLDIDVLNIQQMRWVRVVYRSDSLMMHTLCSFSSCSDSDKMYFFGGIDRDNYRDNHLYCIEFDAVNVRGRKTRDSKINRKDRQEEDVPDIDIDTLFYTDAGVTHRLPTKKGGGGSILRMQG